MMMAVVEAKSRVEQLKGQGISGELNIDWKGLKSRKLNITDPYEKSTFTGLKIKNSFPSISKRRGRLPVAIM
mgnify:CR=1 FL=1